MARQAGAPVTTVILFAAAMVLTALILTPLLRRWTRDDKALSMPAGSPETRQHFWEDA